MDIVRLRTSYTIENCILCILPHLDDKYEFYALPLVLIVPFEKGSITISNHKRFSSIENEYDSL